MLGRRIRDLVQQLDPREAGHEDVAHDHRDLVEELEGALGRLGCDDLVAAALEDLDHQVADDGLVVDDQDATHA